MKLLSGLCLMMALLLPRTAEAQQLYHTWDIQFASEVQLVSITWQGQPALAAIWQPQNPGFFGVGGGSLGDFVSFLDPYWGANIQVTLTPVAMGALYNPISSYAGECREVLSSSSPGIIFGGSYLYYWGWHRWSAILPNQPGALPDLYRNPALANGTQMLYYAVKGVSPTCPQPSRVCMVFYVSAVWL